MVISVAIKCDKKGPKIIILIVFVMDFSTTKNMFYNYSLIITKRILLLSLFKI